jgi:hypothetical protein
MFPKFYLAADGLSLTAPLRVKKINVKLAGKFDAVV